MPAHPTSDSTSAPDEPLSPAQRLDRRANDLAVWLAIEVVPARLVAWIIHQRCMWRRRIKRRTASRVAQGSSS